MIMTKTEIINQVTSNPSKKTIKLLEKAIEITLQEVLKMYVEDGNPVRWKEKIEELKNNK